MNIDMFHFTNRPRDESTRFIHIIHIEQKGYQRDENVQKFVRVKNKWTRIHIDQMKSC